MSEKITVTYDSDWSDIETEEEELKKYGITLIEYDDVPDFYGCHEVTIEGDLESMNSWINDTQDFNLQDTLRDQYEDEINEKIDFIKEKFMVFKTDHPSLHGDKLIDEFRNYLEKYQNFSEIGSEDYVDCDTNDLVGVCVHYLMYCNDIEVYYDYEKEEITED